MALNSSESVPRTCLHNPAPQCEPPSVTSTPPALHAYWLYRVCACYDFIDGFLMCLENCLMIGIMMPVGVSRLSTLSPGTGRKAEPADTQQAPCTPPPPTVRSPSRQSALQHVHRSVTGGCSSARLPCRTAFSCPGIMSGADMQA